MITAFPYTVCGIIFGLLLSDASLEITTTSINARFSLEMSIHQSAYLVDVFFALSHYCKSYPTLCKHVVSRRIQENTGEYRRIQENIGEYRRIQENTGEYWRIQENTGEYRRIQENTGEYRRIQENTGEYRRIQEDGVVLYSLRFRTRSLPILFL